MEKERSRTTASNKFEDFPPQRSISSIGHEAIHILDLIQIEEWPQPLLNLLKLVFSWSTYTNTIRRELVTLDTLNAQHRCLFNIKVISTSKGEESVFGTGNSNRFMELYSTLLNFTNSKKLQGKRALTQLLYFFTKIMATALMLQGNVQQIFDETLLGKV